LLAKYTFVAILGSLFIAALLVSEYRKALFRPVSLITLLVMLLVAAPHAVYQLLSIGGLHGLPVITQEVVNEETPFVLRGLTGTAGLLGQYALQSLLFVAIIAVLWGPAVSRANLRGALSNPDFRFFAIQSVAGIAVTLIAILGLGISGISAHHPSPLLLSLPIVAILAADSSALLDGDSKWREKLFIGGATVAVIAIFGALCWSLINVFPRYFPGYEAVARTIRDQAGPRAVVVAERFRISGPLRVQAPGFETYALDMATRVQLPSPAKRSGGCAAVWWDRGDSVPPEALVRYAEQITRQVWPTPGKNSIVVANSTDARVEPARSRIELLPAGGICDTTSDQAADQN
jgi:hypothetical protein